MEVALLNKSFFFTEADELSTAIADITVPAHTIDSSQGKEFKITRYFQPLGPQPDSLVTTLNIRIIVIPVDFYSLFSLHLSCSFFLILAPLSILR